MAEVLAAFRDLGDEPALGAGRRAGRRRAGRGAEGAGRRPGEHHARPRRAVLDRGGDRRPGSAGRRGAVRARLRPVRRRDRRRHGVRPGRRRRGRPLARVRPADRRAGRAQHAEPTGWC
nr:hypothetical protein [Angustibacter aerolatus]